MLNMIRETSQKLFFLSPTTDHKENINHHKVNVTLSPNDKHYNDFREISPSGSHFNHVDL